MAPLPRSWTKKAPLFLAVLLLAGGGWLRFVAWPWHSNLWAIDWLSYYEPQAEALASLQLHRWLLSWEGLHPPVSGVVHGALMALGSPLSVHWAATVAATLGGAVFLARSVAERSSAFLGLAVVGWASLSPLQANYGLNTSPYPWVLLFVGASVFALARASECAPSRARRPFIVAAVLAGLALQTHVLAFAVALGSLLAMILVPGGPLAGTIELRPGVEMPVWAEAMVPMLFVLFLTPGVAFGIANGTIRNDRDIAGMMTATMASMGGYVVLAFFCGQFVAWFAESGLGTVLAIRGIEILSQWNLPSEALVLAVIALTAILNLFIGSASAKWFLLAPVFVPLFLGLGVSPELTQAAYRVGDSATNIIAPLNPYLVIIIVFMRRYEPKAGIGSVLALMLPYALVLLAIWPLFLLAWAWLGIPLGPDNGPLFVTPLGG